MKKIIYSVTIAFAVVCGSTAHASHHCDVYVNNTKIAGEISDSGKVNLPIRNFFETAGYVVQWEGDTHRATAYSSDNNVIIYENSRYLYIDNFVYICEEAPKVINGVFMMPISAAIKCLDAKIIYQNNAVYINSDKIVDDDGWDYDILIYVNEKRREYGLKDLVWNSDFARAAKYRCYDMENRGYFSHYSPEGISPFDIMKTMGIKFNAAAENIAAGQPDAKSVVNAWMESEEHRANILNNNLREMGAAYVRGGEYGIYWAQELGNSY